MDFLAFCLVRQKTREGMSGQFLGNALAGLGLFDLYRSGRCGALRFDEHSITLGTRPVGSECASLTHEPPVVLVGPRESN